MRTLTFEQLRINLTLTFDTLDEPIEIVKRGRVVGYLVSNLQDTKDTVKAEVFGATVYEPDPVKPEKVKKISAKKEAVPVAAELLFGVQAKAESKPWFKPCPKEYQTRNVGKGK